LAEEETFPWRDLTANRSFEILKGQFTILVRVEHVEKLSAALIYAPAIHKLGESVELNELLVSFPLDKRFLHGLVTLEGFVNKTLSDLV
jgi:hypothetical protein